MSFNKLLFFVFCSAGSLEGLPESPQEYAAWEDRSLKSIAKASTLPPREAIPELSLRMIQLSRENSPNWEKGQRPVFHAAQAALLAIPGHAEYYRDRVLKAQELYKTQRDSPSSADYRTEQIYALQTLAHLPSPETVRVYGELLTNDWAPPGNGTKAPMERMPLLSGCATVALADFPIQNKPFKERLTQENFADAQSAWLQWFEEIKSGKRTFRFEGDPTEYDLHGPAPKQKLDRIARDARRDAERAVVGRNNRSEPASEGATAPAEETPSKTAAIATAAAGLVLLGSLVWYFARPGKSKSQ